MTAPIRIRFLIGVAISLVAAAATGACGGPASTVPPRPTATGVTAASVQPSPTSVQTSTPTSRPQSSAAPATSTALPSATQAVPTPVPTAGGTAATVPAGQESPDLVKRGKELFEKTAGGIGCAYCHGMDGKGNQAVGAPPNRGMDASAIYNALETRAQMTFMKTMLTDDDIKAIAAYLAVLAEQP